VKDSAGQQLAYVYFEDEPRRRSLLMGVERTSVGHVALIAAIDAFADHQVSTLSCSHKETASFFDLKDS
jgi:hypothetical protein